MTDMKTPAILNGFKLSDPQSSAALARGQDVAVTAGAGTGKTRTLVARYLALLAEGLPLRSIVAITFTRKAAREMRNRVRKEIGRYLAQDGLDLNEKDRWQNLYNELDAARIGTIHNFCAEILRFHPAEAGIDPQFTVLDETRSALLVEEAAEATLAWAVETDEAAPLFNLLRERQLQDLIGVLIINRLTVRELIGQIAADDILAHWQENLHERQADAVERLFSDPVFIDAYNLLAGNRAVNPDDKREMQRRLALGAVTFPDGESLQGKLRSLSALGEITLVGGSQNNWSGGKEQMDEVKEALRRLRDLYKAQPYLHMAINSQDEALAKAMPAIYLLAKRARTSYQALKEERESLDFDDLEAVAIDLLEKHSPVRDYWQSQVQALLVDEFQDTNERQCHFIRLLCPDAGKLFIVGDAKQSIYRFRGADVAVFAKEKDQILQQGGSLFDLDTSYRAHEPLLTGMNHLLRPVLGDDGPNLRPWAAPFAPLKAGISKSPIELAPPYIEFHLTLGTKMEALPRAAGALAQRLAELQHDHDLAYGDMAILCRASSSFQYYENTFDAAGIPYLTVAGKGFYDRPEIRDLLNALQAISDPHDDLTLAGLLRSPACGISDVTLYHISQERKENATLWDTIQRGILLPDGEETQRLETAVFLIHTLHQRSGRTPAADLLKHFLDMTYYRAILRRVGQPRALRNVTKLLDDVHTGGLVSVNEFLEYIQTVRESGAREGEARATSGGAVQIMTIHAAKGLEFPVIVLGDASKEDRWRSDIAIDSQLGILLPYRNENDLYAASYAMWAERAKDQDQAETARLLYVAVTRAKQKLIINGHAQQNKSGNLSWKGWLSQLADICGISAANLRAYDDKGSGLHTHDYTLQETAVRATFYEPSFSALQGSLTSTPMQSAKSQPVQHRLLEAVKWDAPREQDDEAQQHVRQIVATTKWKTAPPWVIGSIVHDALALWRFPGDGFDDWVRARAQGHGITDEQQLWHVQEETVRLLYRFQANELYKEINSAERRWHEVPYSRLQDGMAEQGRIDLLYQVDGFWNLVEFKTDKLREGLETKTLLEEKGYIKQLRGYGRAVKELLGTVPQLKLCLLNYGGRVHIEPVSLDSPGSAGRQQE